MSVVSQLKTPLRHIYKFAELDRVPEGPCSAQVSPRRLLSGETLTTGKSTSVGAVVKGERVQVALVHKARGTGSKIHTHPNEQFNYVLQGTLIADMDGQVFRVPKGHVVHIPAGMPHSHVSSAEEDVIFYAVKDTRHGIVGPPVDGVYNGPRHLPGFGLGNNEWKIGANGLPEPQTQNASGEKIQYVYDIEHLDAVPEGPTSAQVIPRNFISKKSSSFGAALRGDKVQVGHIQRGGQWNQVAYASERAIQLCAERYHDLRNRRADTGGASPIGDALAAGRTAQRHSLGGRRRVDVRGQRHQPWHERAAG